MIHLWLQRASELADTEDGSVLSRTERARASRFRFARERSRYLTNHGWLHERLAELLELRSPDVPLWVDERGALSVEGTAHQLSFSHHGDWLALAVSTSGAVGVDVLTVPPDADFVDDTALVLSPEEISLVKRCPRDRQGIVFARCWVRKEAYAKMLRTGLTADLAAVTLTPAADACDVSFFSRWLPSAALALAADSSTACGVVFHGTEIPGRPSKVKSRGLSVGS